MRKVLALSCMMGIPSVAGLAQVLPSIVAILLFSTTPAGVFQSLGMLGLGINSTLFGYFVSGFFPTPAIGNFIMGL